MQNAGKHSLEREGESRGNYTASSSRTGIHPPHNCIIIQTRRRGAAASTRPTSSRGPRALRSPGDTFKCPIGGPPRRDLNFAPPLQTLETRLLEETHVPRSAVLLVFYVFLGFKCNFRDSLKFEAWWELAQLARNQPGPAHPPSHRPHTAMGGG